MKASNLAVRMDQHETAAAIERATPATALASPSSNPSANPRRRPRLSLSFRTIVLRDQGLPLFRVR